MPSYGPSRGMMAKKGIGIPSSAPNRMPSPSMPSSSPLPSSKPAVPTIPSAMPNPMRPNMPMVPRPSGMISKGMGLPTPPMNNPMGPTSPMPPMNPPMMGNNVQLNPASSLFAQYMQMANNPNFRRRG